MELEPLRTKPEANVTITFSTTQDNGVILYDGQSEHLAVELFNGRIRVSYDVGNYPVSTMFRYVHEEKRVCGICSTRSKLMLFFFVWQF